MTQADLQANQTNHLPSVAATTTETEWRIKTGFQRDPIWSRLLLLIEACRVHQWVKNLLVFVPLITSHQIFQAQSALQAAVCFIAFCALASAVYLLNDLTDLEADRANEEKRKRPFASGRLPVSIAFWAVPILLIVGLTLSFLVNRNTGFVAIGYITLTLLYSFWLKEQLLLDVFALASLYTIRIFAGQAAYHVPLSTWLVSYSMFLFLSLGFCKRTSELSRMQIQLIDRCQRRDYRRADLPIITGFGVAAGYAAGLISILYIESDNVRRLYHNPDMLWLLCPLNLYWITRLWMITFRGQMTLDPVAFAIKDRITWAVTVVLGLVLLAAL